MPPSHFESSAQVPRRAAQLSGTAQASPWIRSAMTPGDPRTPNPSLAISQAQEILELRRENERLMLLQKESPRENRPVLSPSDSKTRYRRRKIVLFYESLVWIVPSSPAFSKTGSDGNQSGVWRQRGIRKKRRG